jgi:hypothetical protein
METGHLGGIMKILGGKIWFKNIRDATSYLLGVGMCVYSMISAPPNKWNVGVILAGATIAGLPTAFRQDERKE